MLVPDLSEKFAGIPTMDLFDLLPPPGPTDQETTLTPRTGTFIDSPQARAPRGVLSTRPLLSTLSQLRELHARYADRGVTIQAVVDDVLAMGLERIAELEAEAATAAALAAFDADAETENTPQGDPTHDHRN